MNSHWQHTAHTLWPKPKALVWKTQHPQDGSDKRLYKMIFISPLGCQNCTPVLIVYFTVDQSTQSSLTVYQWDIRRAVCLGSQWGGTAGTYQSFPSFPMRACRVWIRHWPHWGSESVFKSILKACEAQPVLLAWECRLKHTHTHTHIFCLFPSTNVEKQLPGFLTEQCQHAKARNWFKPHHVNLHPQHLLHSRSYVLGQLLH